MTAQEAIAVAQRAAATEQWEWIEPAAARPIDGGARFEVTTNLGGLGARVRMVVDAAAGVVIEQGYVPR